MKMLVKGIRNINEKGLEDNEFDLRLFHDLGILNKGF